jgi:hypothetical protein
VVKIASSFIIIYNKFILGSYIFSIILQYKIGDIYEKYSFLLVGCATINAATLDLVVNWAVHNSPLIKQAEAD